MVKKVDKNLRFCPA